MFVPKNIQPWKYLILPALTNKTAEKIIDVINNLIKNFIFKSVFLPDLFFNFDVIFVKQPGDREQGEFCFINAV